MGCFGDAKLMDGSCYGVNISNIYVRSKHGYGDGIICSNFLIREYWSSIRVLWAYSNLGKYGGSLSYDNIIINVAREIGITYGVGATSPQNLDQRLTKRIKRKLLFFNFL
jgi:hypothetical protein